MITPQRVAEILSQHMDSYRKTTNFSPFIEGLILMRHRSNNVDELTLNFAAEHDIFYSYRVDELPKLTEMDVITLNRLGWILDPDAGEIFVYRP